MNGPATVQGAPLSEVLDVGSIKTEGNLVVATFTRLTAQGPARVRLFEMLAGGQIHHVFSST